MQEYREIRERRIEQFAAYLRLMRRRQRDIASGNCFIIFSENPADGASNTPVLDRSRAAVVPSGVSLHGALGDDDPFGVSVGGFCDDPSDDVCESGPGKIGQANRGRGRAGEGGGREQRAGNRDAGIGRMCGAGQGRAGGPLPYSLARNSFALDASTRIRQMHRLVVDESVTFKISARKMRAILDRLCIVLHPLSP